LKFKQVCWQRCTSVGCCAGVVCKCGASANILPGWSRTQLPAVCTRQVQSVELCASEATWWNDTSTFNRSQRPYFLPSATDSLL